MTDRKLSNTSFKNRHPFLLMQDIEFYYLVKKFLSYLCVVEMIKILLPFEVISIKKTINNIPLIKKTKYFLAWKYLLTETTIMQGIFSYTQNLKPKH